MGLSTAFKSIGNAITVAAKYTSIGISGLFKVASKAKTSEPGLEILIAAIAGPQAAAITSLAFNVLIDVATALEKVGADVSPEQLAQGLNIQLTLQTINDIKAVFPQLKKILQGLETSIPSVVK